MSHSEFEARIFLLLCLLHLLVGSMICEGGIAQTHSFWADTFNDGDYDGWSVERGSFEVRNGSLVGWGIPIPNAATIYHSSSGAYGTWSFEINGYTPSVWFIASSPNTHNVTGYRFGRVVDGNISSFSLYRVLDGQETRLSYNLTLDEPALYRIEIERNMDGLLTIAANESEIISTTDTNITTSTYFVFGVFSPGGSLDNVMVDSILLPTTTETTVPTVIAIIVVTSVLSIAELRRRS